MELRGCEHHHACLFYKRKVGNVDVSQMLINHDTSKATESDVGVMGVTRKFDEKCIRNLIAMMIIVDELPFTTVQKKGFKNLINYLEPRFKIPSRYTIMRDCMQLYLDEKAKLRNGFKVNGYRVCFTTDTWTSIQNFNYMCVTGHFIDAGWTLHKRVLSFRKVEDHKGATIAKELEDCMFEWGIERILTITVDNASANDVAIDQVKRRQLHGDGVVCGHDFIHLRCSAHILNLIVTEGLKEVDDSISKIRNMIRYVKSSPSRLIAFKKCVERRNIQCGQFLTLDVSTRWNSTYLMLSVAEKYQRAFELMLDDDGVFVTYLKEDGHGRKGLGPPTFDDWEHIRHFIKLLKLFYDVTLRMSGSLVSTANVYFEELAKIHRHLVKYSCSGDKSLEEMALRMMTKYNKYWGDLVEVNRLLFVAAMLDPRFKLMMLEFWFKKVMGEEEGRGMATIVRGTLNRLFEEYSDSGAHSSSCMDLAHVGRDVVIEGQGSKDDDDDWDDFDEYRRSQTALDSKSEVERYLMESVEAKSPTFDILMWWKVNSVKYPTLARIARDVLAIPITTVPSESVFSTGGRVLDPFRSSLAPNTIQGLICAQNWFRSEPVADEDDMTPDMNEDPQSYKMDAGNSFG